MAKCFYCGDALTGYPFVCRLCGESHCGKHRLPESHECINIGVYKSNSYRNTQLSKNREMRKIKKGGSFSPQGETPSRSSFGSSGNTLTFNSSLLGQQTVHFLDPAILSAFIGGLIFGFVQVIGLIRFNQRLGIPIDFSSYLVISIAGEVNRNT